MSKLSQVGRLTSKLIVLIIIMAQSALLFSFAAAVSTIENKLITNIQMIFRLEPRVFDVRRRIRRVLPGTGRQHVTGPTHGDQRYHFIFLLEEMKQIRGIRQCSTRHNY